MPDSGFKYEEFGLARAPALTWSSPRRRVAATLWPLGINGTVHVLLFGERLDVAYGDQAILGGAFDFHVRASVVFDEVGVVDGADFAGLVLDEDGLLAFLDAAFIAGGVDIRSALQVTDAAFPGAAEGSGVGESEDQKQSDHQGIIS